MDDAARSTLTGTDQVRVVKQTPDPYAGLKGHDYIKARNLAEPVRRIVQTSAHLPDGAPYEVRK